MVIAILYYLYDMFELHEMSKRPELHRFFFAYLMHWFEDSRPVRSISHFEVIKFAMGYSPSFQNIQIYPDQIILSRNSCCSFLPHVCPWASIASWHLWTLQDYFKNGVWQNDLMRLDIEVIDAHRREAVRTCPVGSSGKWKPPEPRMFSESMDEFGFCNDLFLGSSW